MATYITAVHMSPSTANDHEHISEVKWAQPNQTGNCTREAMIKFIDAGNAVYVEDRPDARVLVADGHPRHLRTYADARPTNNLLNLPRFCA